MNVVKPRACIEQLFEDANKMRFISGAVGSFTTNGTTYDISEELYKDERNVCTYVLVRCTAVKDSGLEMEPNVAFVGTMYELVPVSVLNING